MAEKSPTEATAYLEHLTQHDWNYNKHNGKEL